MRLGLVESVDLFRCGSTLLESSRHIGHRYACSGRALRRFDLRRSKGIDLGAGLATPEDVTASWQQIAGEPNEM
jgi:hypothetical protein